MQTGSCLAIGKATSRGGLAVGRGHAEAMMKLMPPSKTASTSPIIKSARFLSRCVELRLSSFKLRKDYASYSFCFRVDDLLVYVADSLGAQPVALLRGVIHLHTCTHVRLLSPCFKTGRRGPLFQRLRKPLFHFLTRRVAQASPTTHLSKLTLRQRLPESQCSLIAYASATRSHIPHVA